MNLQLPFLASTRSSEMLKKKNASCVDGRSIRLLLLFTSFESSLSFTLKSLGWSPIFQFFFSIPSASIGRSWARLFLVFRFSFPNTLCSRVKWSSTQKKSWWRVSIPQTSNLIHQIRDELDHRTTVSCTWGNLLTTLP